MLGSTLLLLSSAALVLGHGRVTQPPSRASAWRYGFPTPANYDDDGLNCGGFANQWSGNGGKCGICGDAYQIPTPRPHELGGTYGQGVIVAKYLPSAVIPTTTHLTASHMGYWEFKLCPDPTDNSQECFDRHPLELENGDTKYTPNRGSGIYNVNYKLPGGIVCDHCVLQWRYVAGNNWGVCRNGTAGLGCGNQEEFRACSDVAIGMSKTLSEEVVDNKIPSPLVFYLQNGYYELNKGHLTHQDPKRPTQPHRPANTKPSNRQPKPSQFQLKPSQQYPKQSLQQINSQQHPSVFQQYSKPSQQHPNPSQQTNSQQHPNNIQQYSKPFQVFHQHSSQLKQHPNHFQQYSKPSQQSNPSQRQPKPSQQNQLQSLFQQYQALSQQHPNPKQPNSSKQPNPQKQPNLSQLQLYHSPTLAQQLPNHQRQPNSSKQQLNQSQRQPKPSQQLSQSQRLPKPSKQQSYNSQGQTKPSKQQLNTSIRQPNPHRQSKPSKKHPKTSQRHSKHLRHNSKQKKKQKTKSKKRKKAQQGNQKTRDQRFNHL